MRNGFVLCPVCGKHKFPAFEDNGTCICPDCGWEHDLSDEENPMELYGPNDLCLNDYRLRYAYYIERNPDYRWIRDGYPDIPQIEKSTCPVCGKFQFEPISWDDLYCGVTPSDIYCLSCGWHYEYAQDKSRKSENSANGMSLEEYKEWYKTKIEQNPNYSYIEEQIESYIPTPHKCPVCKKYEFKDESCHDICPFCGWEDDGTEDCTDEVGANGMTYFEYKRQYHAAIKQNPLYRWDKEEV